jgi:hypothetical protein
MDPNDPVAVYSTNDLYEAELIKQFLHTEGLTCELDGVTQGGFVELFEVKVLVRGADADQARTLIEQHRRDRAEGEFAESEAESDPESESSTDTDTEVDAD